jgi:ABC-type Fe3+-hydroxamate transport system substrate-binding protein
LVAESVRAGGVVEDEMVGRKDMNGTDEREGMGCIAWTMATIVLAIALAMFSCGCEDDGDRTTINESDIIVGSNSQVVVVSGNSGTVAIDQTTSETGDDPSIFVSGNTGRVYVTTRPYIPEPEPEEP